MQSTCFEVKLVAIITTRKTLWIKVKVEEWVDRYVPWECIIRVFLWHRICWWVYSLLCLLPWPSLKYVLFTASCSQVSNDKWLQSWPSRPSGLGELGTHSKALKFSCTGTPAVHGSLLHVYIAVSCPLMQVVQDFVQQTADVHERSGCTMYHGDQQP